MQEAFAAHLRHVARLYPAERHGRVVLIFENAPWHRGKPIDEALADRPHMEFYRLPIDSPQVNAIERSWRVLRRRGLGSARGPASFSITAFLIAKLKGRAD